MLARVELRRGWRTLVVLGLLAGLGLGGALAAGQLARRTSTAYERLEATSGTPDAVVLSTDRSGAARPIAGFREVARVWDGVTAIGLVEGDAVRYAGVFAGLAPPPPGLFTPLVVEGRALRPGADDELLVTERLAGLAGLQVGDELPVRFLTADEVAQFDTGFGTPDGPRIRMRIVGVIRAALGEGDAGPETFSTPAFARRLTAASSTFPTVLVRLREGEAITTFRRSIERLEARTATLTGAEEFARFEVQEPGRQRPVVAVTARVVVAGLTVFAVIAAAAALLGVGLVLRRHVVARAARDDRTLGALGVSRRQRLWVQVVAGWPFVATATAGALVVALAAAGIDPIGSMGDREPNPGWHANVALLAVGALLVALVAFALLVVTAVRPRRRGGRTGSATDRRMEWLATVGVPTPAVIGYGFAVNPGRGRAALPVRGALVAMTVVVAGIVGVATFGASLDDVVGDPTRWGWRADAQIADVDDALVAALRADPRVATVAVAEEFQVRIGGLRASAQAVAGRPGIGWTVLDGRRPRGSGEVLLGERLARRLGVAVGDRVTLRAPGGEAVTLAVTGTGSGPDLTDGQFAGGLLVSRADVERVALTQPFRDALVRFRPGADADATRRALGREVELIEPARPPDVDNLAQLGRLPEVLVGFLALLGAALLANALLVAARRRRHELDTLRAVGFVRRQVVTVFVTAATVSVGVALLVGTGFGILVGRWAWRFTAHSAYVAAQLVVPVGPLLGFAGGTLAGAVGLALLTGRRATGRPAAEGLRTE